MIIVILFFQSGYYLNRSNAIKQLIEAGENPYMEKFNVSMSMAEFIRKFSDRVEKDEILKDQVHSIVGRIISLRSASSKLFFYNVYSEGMKIQMKAQANHYEEDAGAFKKDIGKLRRGDIVGIVGVPTKTKTGEFSILPRKIKLLSPCLHVVPSAAAAAAASNIISNNKDKTIMRHYRRCLDLLLDNNARNKIITRSNIISFIRQYLDKMNFLEIETPMMCANSSGANAKPFVTHHSELNMNLFMRISPELYHKVFLFIYQCINYHFNHILKIY